MPNFRTGDSKCIEMLQYVRLPGDNDYIDMQFKPLKDRNRVGVAFNLVSKEEHVATIERYHRVIKERCRCYCAMLPFKYLPRQMVVGFMKTVVFYINSFAWIDGVSSVLPPLSIV